MPVIDHDGRFRAQVVSYGLDIKEGRSSKGFWCKYALVSEWLDREKRWHDLTGLDTAEGVIWFVKANGEKNDRAIETLKHALGWDGQAASLNGETEWKPADCQVIVEKETYNNKTRMKVQWVNPWEGDGIPKPKAGASHVLNLQSLLDGKTSSEQFDGQF